MDQSQLPELVRDTELRTRFDQHYTIHEFLDAPHSLAPPRQEVWKKVRAIGRGGFSYVFLEQCVQGQEEGSPHTRAVKVIPLTQGSDTRLYSRELEAVAKFSQRKFMTYFVKSFGWYSTAEELFISLEYFPLGDLQTYLNSTSCISDDDAREITRQVLCGLNFMHNEGFAHRDLKPANILIKSCPPSPWWIKLGDFGLSKRTDATQMPSVAGGTSGFIAPDILETIYLGNCNTNGTPEIIPHERWIAADIWSLGEVVVRMLSGKATFRSHEHLMSYFLGTRSFPVSNLGDYGMNLAAIDFVQNAMTAKAADRITSQAGLAHHWVKVPTDPNTAFLPRSSPEPESNMNKTVSSIEYRGWTTSKLLANTPPIMPNSVSQATNSQPKESSQMSIKRKPLPTLPVVDDKSLVSVTNEASINVRSLDGNQSNIHSAGTPSTELLSSLGSADSQSSVALSSKPTSVQPGTLMDIAADASDEQHPLDYVVVEDGKIEMGQSPLETIELKDTITSLEFSLDPRRLFITSATEFISWNQNTSPADAEQHNVPQGITSLFFDPDRRYAVLITGNGEIQLADVESKLTFRTILRLQHQPVCAAFSRDSKLIAYSPGDKSIIIVERSSGAVIRKLKSLFGGHKKPIHWVIFDYNGDVVSICRGGRVCIWVSAKGYDCIRVDIPLVREPTLVAFAWFGMAIAAASGRTVMTWSRYRGRYRGDWQRISRQSPVTFMEFSPCGSRLYLCLESGSFELWRVPGDEAPDLVVAVSATAWQPGWTPNAIALSPYESHVALSSGGQLRTWDIRKLLHVYNTLNHFRHAVFADLSADGTKATSFCPISVGEEVADHHHIVIIWDLQTASIMHVLQNKSNSVHTVAFSQDSRRLAVVSSDGVTTFRRVSTGKVIATVGQSIRTGFSLACAAVSPDFRYVVTVEHDPNQWGIRIWNTETGSTEHFLGWYELPDTEESKTANGPPYSPPRALKFLSNSRDLVGGNEYGIFICDVLEGNIQHRSSSTSRASQRAPWGEESREQSTKYRWSEYAYHWDDGLQISPDSETVAYLTKRGKAYLYDLKNSDEPRIFESWTAPGRVAISPDWRLLVTTSWNKIVIWEISTNHIVKVLQDIRGYDHEPIEAVVFSPDSKHVFVLRKTCLLIGDIESLGDLAVITHFSRYPGSKRSLLVSADLGRVILGPSWRLIDREERVQGGGVHSWREYQKEEMELWDYKEKVIVQVFSKLNLRYKVSIK